MLERDTTFILGAGASFDLGFPLGDTLRDRIIELLAVEDPNASINFSDAEMGKILQTRSVSEAGTNASPDRLEVYRRAAATIRAGLPFARSIDTFIDGLRGREHIEFLSKLAIATVILRAEAGSPLTPRHVQAANAADLRAQQLKKLLASWHVELSQILYDGHTADTLDDVFAHASFIVFNYDRCLEEFLAVSLMRRFGIDRKRAVALVGNCQVVHPYGQVGAFAPDAEGFIPFGGHEVQQLVDVAGRIRTFTETMESDVGDKIKDTVAQADTLVFLGFGWLAQNMALLQVGQRLTNARQVFATTMKMEAGEVAVVRDQIYEILRRGDYTPDYVDPAPDPPEFITDRGDCKALMANCWLRLTRR
ncbi:hypothetical protein [Sphingomonas nostoxanthinifaciens]|uniref:hypothetical protein n=1 Tax=Sphingomonas nostoxanthinifaciens TaxID=2872652 RepID=UPI001CC21A72|nr:hypothetical protein [Sphingomonas nostoxanthinifaciens]UAK23845.1 hypothetical protein K8P63_15930 [Sphingomonas nostoxanthinifaciens]